MRSTRNTAKEKIIDAAWELFQEVGYENATVNDIIKKSGTSRGAFYHHFRAKEDLLFQMAWYFDQGYEGWLENQPQDQNPITTLYKFLIFTLESVENSKYKDFLSQLYGYEVMTDGNRPIIDEQRLYFKTLLSLCADARNKKLISEEWSGVHPGQNTGRTGQRPDLQLASGKMPLLPDPHCRTGLQISSEEHCYNRCGSYIIEISQVDNWQQSC